MSNLMSHMRTSAEAGNVDAQFNLGVSLYNGLDDRGNVVGGKRSEAIVWLRKAAKGGSSRAQCRLAEAYAEEDAPEEQERACAWFLVAMSNADGGGRQTAHDKFESLARSLSVEQLARAKSSAQDWSLKIAAGLKRKEREIAKERARTAFLRGRI